MRYLVGFVLAVGVVASSPGVSAQDPPASTLEPASFVAPEDKALVVFVRLQQYAFEFYVLDGNKKLLTFLRWKEHVTIEVAPGKHTFYFYIRFENASLVRAELAAGRTYIVRTQYEGRIKPRVRAHPVLRNSADFAESAKWIREAKRGEPDFAKGNERVQKHQEAIDGEITAAELDWLKMDEKARSSITLRPEDGRTPDEASKL